MRSAFGVEDSRLSKGADDPPPPVLTKEQVRQRDRRGVAVLGATGAALGGGAGGVLGAAGAKPKFMSARIEHAEAARHQYDAGRHATAAKQHERAASGLHLVDPGPRRPASRPGPWSTISHEEREERAAREKTRAAFYTGQQRLHQEALGARDKAHASQHASEGLAAAATRKAKSLKRAGIRITGTSAALGAVLGGAAAGTSTALALRNRKKKQ